jgi:alkylhydroperoxidase family enzyme
VAFVEEVSEQAASEDAAEMFAVDRERFGYVPNFTRALAHRPVAYAAWRRLNGAIIYCALAHGKVPAERFLDPASVRDIATDHRSAGLEPVDVAVRDFAERVPGDAGSITRADVERLRGLGLSDGDVVDVVLAAAVRSFFSKTLDALGVEPDRVYADLEPGLREALTVGRPIAEA